MNLNKKRNLIISFLLFLFFFLINVKILSNYGICWYGTSHFIRGQTCVQKIIGQTKRRSICENSLINGRIANYSYSIKNDGGHPPLSGEIASLFNYIFYQQLGIFGELHFNIKDPVETAFYTSTIFLLLGDS